MSFLSFGSLGERRATYAPSTVYGLGRGVAFAVPLAPGRAVRRTAAAGPRCFSPSSTSPSATWVAATLLILMMLTLHRMVWRDADADDDARSSRRGLPVEHGAGFPLAQNLPLHWMVWRACGASDHAQGRRRGLSAHGTPGKRAHRAVWPRGLLAGTWVWGLLSGVEAVWAAVD